MINKKTGGFIDFFKFDEINKNEFYNKNNNIIKKIPNEINNIYDRKVEYDLENIIINDESMAYINVLNPFIFMDKLYPYLDIKKNINIFSENGYLMKKIQNNNAINAYEDENFVFNLNTFRLSKLKDNLVINNDDMFDLYKNPYYKIILNNKKYSICQIYYFDKYLSNYLKYINFMYNNNNNTYIYALLRYYVQKIYKLNNQNDNIILSINEYNIIDQLMFIGELKYFLDINVESFLNNDNILNVDNDDSDDVVLLFNIISNNNKIYNDQYSRLIENICTSNDKLFLISELFKLVINIKNDFYSSYYNSKDDLILKIINKIKIIHNSKVTNLNVKNRYNNILNKINNSGVKDNDSELKNIFKKILDDMNIYKYIYYVIKYNDNKMKDVDFEFLFFYLNIAHNINNMINDNDKLKTKLINIQNSVDLCNIARPLNLLTSIMPHKNNVYVLIVLIDYFLNKEKNKILDMIYDTETNKLIKYDTNNTNYIKNRASELTANNAMTL